MGVCWCFTWARGTVIDWIAYGHAFKLPRRKERYGTGDIRGVIAPESANNAKEGGALVPTLLFGIPGSGSMAILLGGFVLIGIEPGVDTVTSKLDLVYLSFGLLVCQHHRSRHLFHTGASDL